MTIRGVRSRATEDMREEMVHLDDDEKIFVRLVLGGVSKSRAFREAFPNLAKGLSSDQVKDKYKALWTNRRIQAFIHMMDKPVDEQASYHLLQEMHFSSDPSARKAASAKLLAKKQEDAKTGIDIWIDTMRRCGAEIVKPCEKCDGVAIASMSEVLPEDAS